MRKALFLLVMVLLQCEVAAAQETVDRSFFLPVSLSGGQTLKLEAFASRAKNQPGRLPLLLISHGTDEKTSANKAIRPENYRSLARDFARRGWHVVAISRQGFGHSEGMQPQAGACGPTHRIDHVFDVYANNLVAAVEALAQDKDIDASRVLFIGTSTGGLTSLLAASRLKGRRAFAINFSGGWRSTNCDWVESVAGIFASAGQKSDVPSLWLYAANDSYFGPPLVDKFLAAYRHGGGKVEFTRYPAIGEDGHYLMGTWRGRERWLPDVDRFLLKHNLPGLSDTELRKIIQSSATPEALKRHVERYLRLPGEKALAITADRARVFWHFGAHDEADARTKVLNECNKVQPDCTLKMINNLPKN